MWNNRGCVKIFAGTVVNIYGEVSMKRRYYFTELKIFCILQAFLLLVTAAFGVFLLLGAGSERKSVHCHSSGMFYGSNFYTLMAVVTKREALQ